MNVIRIATEDDAESLLRIYAYYVTNTAISFEYEVPSVDEFKERIRRTLRKYPYLILECDGGVTGYAYAGAFKQRSAYDWAVETTIYIAREERGKGHGRILYTALEQALAAQGIINLNACIAFPVVPDEYLTGSSVHFHEKMGYRMVGEFHKCGYKFNKWYDMVWMEKCICKHPEHPARIKAFEEVHTSFCSKSD